MDEENPYSTPNAELDGNAVHSIPTIVYILGSLAVISSMWFLWLDGRKWFSPEYDMSTAEVVRDWVTRAFYGLPKIGVVFGLISLYKFEKYSFRIYLFCWFLAIGHTIMYYVTYSMEKFNFIESLRIVEHHIIPHIFYLTMLLMLYIHKKAANNSSKSTPKVGAI